MLNESPSDAIPPLSPVARRAARLRATAFAVAPALASGLLVAASYPPFNQDWLIWLALAPLMWALLGLPGCVPVSPARGFLLGWLSGTANFLVCIAWISEVTIAGWILLSLYCGLFTGLFGIFVSLLGSRLARPPAAPSPWLSSRANLAAAFLCACAWVVCEWLRGTLFTGFGWNALGIALWRNTPMIQFSDIAGVAGLSFFIVATNVMVALTIARLHHEIGTGRLRPHYDFALTIALVALVFTYGIRQIFRGGGETKELSIAAVQAAIPQYEKWAPEFEEQILEKYRTRSETAIAMDPDLLLWPEAATPRAVFSDFPTWSAIREIASKWDGDFLLGTMHFDATGDFNSALLLTGRASEARLYHKIHLVPFGEFIPFRNSFPLFAWIVGDLVSGDFDPGSEFTLLETVRNPVKIAPLICFEDTLGPLARNFARDGAQLFVNLTNDGWFRRSAASVQHLSHAVFRSAENKLPMVRSANTGVTCVIDRFGFVREKLAGPDGDTFIEGILFARANVPLNPQPTFYGRNGEIFAYSCMAVSLACCAAFFFTRKNRRLSDG